MMRLRTALFATLLACCVTLGASQPGSCIEDVDCREGYFCETPVYVCHECLKCQDLKREPPRSPQSCIKSLRECGPCLEGLVEDRRGDLNCVPPIARDRGVSAATEGNSTAWIVAGITIALVFVVAVGAVFIRYMCRNSLIKFNVDTNIDATMPTRVVATAPEAPPPYSPAPPTEDPPQPDEDTSRPLIKPYQPPYPAYESQDYQNVSMFNPPAYVRLNGLRAKGQNDVNDNYNPPSVHEEDTTPSAWTPGQQYSEAAADPAVNGATSQSSEQHPESESAGDFSTALAIARNTDLIQSPPVTLRMQALSSSDKTDSDDDAHAHSNATGSSVRTSRNGNSGINVMNVNQIITIIKPPL